jgi:glycosyltransferase involved in cell wall biosynthesis
VGTYQRKLEEMAALPDVELTVVVPPSWRDERGVMTLERAYTRGYKLIVEPLRFNGKFHLHYYPGFARLLTRFKPDLVHLDEEPYNLATWHAQRAAAQFGAKTLFFSWQNLQRRYPWPFRRFEADVLAGAAAAIAGSAAAAEVWRAKGFDKPMPVIPQFGVDPDLFQPDPAARAQRPEGQFVVGFAGRLVREKGVDVLLRAVAQLASSVVVRIAGAGPERVRLERLATELGLGDRVRFQSLLPSRDMPAFLNTLDCLILPSRTIPTWKEQFGRVLIEAMACGIPVLASDSGEPPNVIGQAGVIFPEGSSDLLARHLNSLLQQPEQRAQLGARGRARVLQGYTQHRVAQATVALYRALMSNTL